MIPCKQCGGPITVMVQRDSGFCCPLCEMKYPHETESTPQQVIAEARDGRTVALYAEEDQLLVSVLGTRAMAFGFDQAKVLAANLDYWIARMQSERTSQ